jgi:hypothetical protein
MEHIISKVLNLISLVRENLIIPECLPLCRKESAPDGQRLLFERIWTDFITFNNRNVKTIISPATNGKPFISNIMNEKERVIKKAFLPESIGNPDLIPPAGGVRKNISHNPL